MRYLLPMFCALLIGTPAVALAETTVSMPKTKAVTGDFDDMIKRRIIRILVVPNKTYFFLHKGESFGLTAEVGREFEKWINKRHANGPYKINVALGRLNDADQNDRNELRFIRDYLRDLGGGRQWIASWNLPQEVP